MTEERRDKWLCWEVDRWLEGGTRQRPREIHGLEPIWDIEAAQQYAEDLMLNDRRTHPDYEDDDWILVAVEHGPAHVVVFRCFKRWRIECRPETDVPPELLR